MFNVTEQGSDRIEVPSDQPEGCKGKPTMFCLQAFLPGYWWTGYLASCNLSKAFGPDWVRPITNFLHFLVFILLKETDGTRSQQKLFNSKDTLWSVLRVSCFSTCLFFSPLGSFWQISECFSLVNWSHSTSVALKLLKKLQHRQAALVLHFFPFLCKYIGLKRQVKHILYWKIWPVVQWDPEAERSSGQHLSSLAFKKISDATGSWAKCEFKVIVYCVWRDDW